MEFEIFSTEGRIGRLDYFKYSMAEGIVTFLTIMLVIFLGGGGDEPGAVAIITVMIIALVAAAGGITLAVRRLHDLNRSGAHYWLLFIPFYNIYLSMLLTFKQGTRGPNRFGEDPLAEAREGLLPA